MNSEHHSDRLLSLKDFHYEIPEELVAQEPLADRAGSRLLVHHADQTIDHTWIKSLPDLLPKGTHLIVNDTRVVPGRLLGHTSHGGKIELMLLRPLETETNTWSALGKPFKKLQVGQVITFPGDCLAEIIKREEQGSQPSLAVRFNLSFEDFWGWMEREGYIPLPPYIRRKDALSAPDSSDRERYQTIYAREKGSVAAPTAGLHFSEDLWAALIAKGITPVPVTLHVGGGTFLPVKNETIADHAMHRERYMISRGSYETLQKALRDGNPIVAVGTTSLRCIESFSRLTQTHALETLLDQWHETGLFLYPETKQSRIKPWAISGLITNFHQSESSLLMLVSALIGYDPVRVLYQKAIEEKYRFYSYGDASLLWLPDTRY
ncbi:MAG: tRNA preQ1(34) S-adenosylmethionine ribosyltransferase-isomerase QueA [Chitinophagaceae bacterium]|nr:tRNA preQ1(34) S-adenosylmethionine ribosyltransferase-isomerase QueA [Oligoflexus sp.]